MTVFLTQKEVQYSHDLVCLYQVLEDQIFYDIKYIHELSGCQTTFDWLCDGHGPCGDGLSRRVAKTSCFGLNDG